MTLETLLLTAIPAAISIAVAWGMIRMEVTSMKEAINELKARVDKCVSKETCEQSHRHTDKAMLDMQSDIREIKQMVYRLIEHMGGPK